jgi:hypothetical protein
LHDKINEFCGWSSNRFPTIWDFIRNHNSSFFPHTNTYSPTLVSVYNILGIYANFIQTHQLVAIGAYNWEKIHIY